MPQVRGRAEIRQFIASLPDQIERKLLPGAARAAGKVIAEEAKERAISSVVADAIIVRTKRADHRVAVKVTVKPGWPYSVGNWLEWGTSQHFITVDASQRDGRSVRRINELASAPGSNHSLVINGQFVGDTVLHPGARPHPFLRPALDLKERDAIAAAQAYINSRISRHGIVGDADQGGDEE